MINSIKRKIKSIFQKEQKLPFSNNERERIKKLPRFNRTESYIFNNKIIIPDSVSFLGSYDEIFNDEIYNYSFDNKNDNINIIDCGANIGLATIYFKMKYPNSKIISYEPDPNIFNALKQNIESFSFDNVTLKNEAISNKEGEINFFLEGGHSGMIVKEEEGSEENVIKVKTIRLKDILSKIDKISFLKIDIEGHEETVVPDIEDQLYKVDTMFLEYHSFINDSQTLDELLSIIRRCGFRYYIKEASNKKNPFIQKELFLGMDLLVNIFCYRN